MRQSDVAATEPTPLVLAVGFDPSRTQREFYSYVSFLYDPALVQELGCIGSQLQYVFVNRGSGTVNDAHTARIREITRARGVQFEASASLKSLISRLENIFPKDTPSVGQRVCVTESEVVSGFDPEANDLVRGLKAEISDLRSQLDTARSTIDDLRTHVECLTEALKSKPEEVPLATLSALQRHLDKALDSNRAKEWQIHELQRQARTLREELEQRNNDDKDETIKELNLKLRNLQAELLLRVEQATAMAYYRRLFEQRDQSPAPRKSRLRRT